MTLSKIFESLLHYHESKNFIETKAYPFLEKRFRFVDNRNGQVNIDFLLHEAVEMLFVAGSQRQVLFFNVKRIAGSKEAVWAC